MKTVNRNFGMMIALFIALGFSTVAQANDPKKDSTVEFKYIGEIKNKPVFQLNVQNDNEDEYTISIADQHGEVLYFSRVKGKNVNRKFMLNTDELDGSLLRVEVKAKRNDKAEVFEIVNNTRLVQETSVSKL